MKLLLDTHALLWMISDDHRLSSNARNAILSAKELHWSIVSLWELAVKESLERFDLKLSPGWHEWIPGELRRNGALQMDVLNTHCHVVSQLPWHHRDPFDRMLVAQAKTEGAILVTRDGLIRAYDVECVW